MKPFLTAICLLFAALVIGLARQQFRGLPIWPFFPQVSPTIDLNASQKDCLGWVYTLGNPTISFHSRGDSFPMVHARSTKVQVLSSWTFPLSNPIFISNRYRCSLFHFPHHCPTGRRLRNSVCWPTSEHMIAMETALYPPSDGRSNNSSSTDISRIDLSDLNDPNKTHHLLKHCLSDGQKNDALVHFGTLDVKEAARDISKMGQRDLQSKFKLVYGAATHSNNNDWLRRKLYEGMVPHPTPT